LTSLALITGASRGIGAATAHRFAAAGWNLQLLARSSDDLDAVAASCRAQGISVACTTADLGDAARVAPAIHSLLEQAGCPDLVINNAGAGLTAALAETSLEQWQWLLQLNLTSIFQVCSTLLPQLRRKGGGLIINVSSHAARKAFPGWGAYCTSKAALEAFSRCLAEEERCHGIRVSTLTLGSVDSSLWDSPTVRADFDRRAMLPTDRVADTLLQIAQHPPQLLLEDLTLMPASGAL
jgi:NAD(P)-dependent dehydrogenase (short-subunit alcohol dehydrogenase family)